MMQRPPRPDGVTVLAILHLIGGIILLVLGALLSIESAAFPAIFGAYAGFVAVFNGVYLLFGVLVIIVGWGFLSGKGWAWTLAVIFYILVLVRNLLVLVLNLLFTIVGSFTSIIFVVINLLLLWYLWRPNVRAYFGKGVAAAPMTPSSPLSP